MLLQTESDLTVLLAIAAAILLGLALMTGIVLVRRTLQVKDLQTQLSKSERKTENLERRIFNVLDAIPVALIETDARGKFTFANRTAHQLLGQKDNALTGLRFQSANWSLTYPDGRVIPPDLLPVARTLRGQTVRGFEHLIINHDTGTKIRVSVTAVPIINTMNEVTGSTTALVELETAAGEGIGDLNGLWRGNWFTSAPTAFFGLDQNGTVLDINPAACTLTGLTREQALGRKLSDIFVAPDDQPEFVNFLTRQDDDSATSDELRALELTLRMPDGQTRETRVSGWHVSTQDGSLQGTTLIALPSTQSVPHAPPADTDAQTISDFPQSEEVTIAPADTQPANENLRYTEGVEYLTLKTRLGALEHEILTLKQAKAELEAREARLDHALQVSESEAGGRLSGQVTQDFGETLRVMNAALEMIGKNTPDSDLKRLSDAALAAGRRGERLTRQLMALSPPKA
ncbi:MAG: PAS domain S-box protein [Asticcacaulis sp.]